MKAITINKRSVRISSALLAALLVLAGCSVAPTYERPPVATSVAYKEAANTDGATTDWKTAQPSEALARGQWWKIFNDSGLDTLEEEAQAARSHGGATAPDS